MSVHMKKHHTNIVKASTQQVLYVMDHDILYAIPTAVAKKYRVNVQTPVNHNSKLHADVIFQHIDEKYGKAGALLRGLRARENLSQVEFAKKINVTQANLSKMENGTRPIGRTIAMRIAKAFSANYKYFL